MQCGCKKIQIKVKKLQNFKGEIPVYQTPGASGMDVRAQVSDSILLSPGERVLVPTGLSMAVPKGFEIQVRPRSGLALKYGLSVLNTPGTVDADYRGEIGVILVNLSNSTFVINDQERIAQLVVCPIVQPDIVEVESLEETERGSGGFGSTGVK